MRTLALCTLLIAGCGGSSGPPVTVQFSQATGTPAALGTGFASSEGTAKIDTVNKLITLESHTVDGDLLIQCDTPNQPLTVAIDEFDLQVNYTLPDGTSWSSTLPTNDTAGTVTFKTITSPYLVTIKHMAMIGSTSRDTGSFYIDGSGEFAQ